MLIRFLLNYLTIGFIVAILDAWGIWTLRKDLEKSTSDAEKYVGELDEILSKEVVNQCVRNRSFWLSILAFAVHIATWPVTCYLTWALLHDNKSS